MPVSSKSSTRSRPKTPSASVKSRSRAAEVSPFVISGKPTNRPTKSKRFQLNDWTHVPAKVRAVWPDDEKVTVELPDGQRYTVREDLIEKMPEGTKPALLDD